MTDPFVDSHISEQDGAATAAAIDDQPTQPRERAQEAMTRVTESMATSSASTTGSTSGNGIASANGAGMNGAAANGAAANGGIANNASPNGAGGNGSGVNGAGPATPAPSVSPDTLRANLAGRHVCPFCGTAGAASAASQPCPRCTMEDTPVTRQATRSRIGPWYVLQTRNPAAPGMKFSTLLALVSKNQVTARSIVRGPTTHQLWRFAAHVRGLSREFGLCYSCGETIDRVSPVCPHCERSQEPPANPDTLLETRDVPVMSAAAAAAANSPVMASASQVKSPLNGAAAARQPNYPANNPAANNPVANSPANFQTPNYPQASFPPAPSTTPRGEHAERLRMLNDGIVSRARPSIPGVRDSRKVSGMDLASALQADPNSVQLERRITVRRALVAMILLALIGGGVYLYLNPPARHDATVWAEEKWLWARDEFAAWQSKNRANSDTLSTEEIDRSIHQRGETVQPSPTDVSSPSNPPQPLSSKQMSAAQPKTSDTDLVSAGHSKNAKGNATESDAVANLEHTKTDSTSTSTVMPTVQGPTQMPAPNPAPTNTANTSPPPPPAPTQASTPAPAPTKQEEPVAATPVEPAADSPEGDAARAQARDLWSKAPSAQADGHIDEALKYFEEIHKLPKFAWQADLELRIQNAKRMLGR